MERNRRKRKSGVAAFGLRWGLRILLYGWVTTIIFPLVWALATSLKSSEDFMLGDVWKWPEFMYLTNYIRAWKEASMGDYALNTLFVALASAGLCILMISTSSYIIAKYDCLMVRWIEKFYFASMMIQGALLLVPKYFLLSNIGKWIEGVLRQITGQPDLIFNLTDNRVTLCIVYACGSIATQIFLVTGFVRAVDNSFIEAARIDGAGEWYTFSKIVFPFVKPIVLFEGLIQFMGTWNEYLTALTFLETESKYTLSVGIQRLVAEYRYQSDYGTVFAGLFISMVPMLILYTIFQNVIQNGMDTSEGLK